MTAHRVLRPLPASILRLWFALALPLLLLAWGAWRYRWMSDDGAINLRVVQQIRAGHGPVFNAGERVEAATSPLWVLLLLMGSYLPGVALEWVAVGLGLGLSLLGLFLAELGAWSRLRRRKAAGTVLPAGALVVAALPAFWTYATAGLETGLSLAWLGACCCALTTFDGSRAGAGAEGRAHLNHRSRVVAVSIAVLVSLGPLIRPDFVLFTVVFGASLLVVLPDRRGRLTTIVTLVAAPLGYQVFRMGYYGSLVPNPALAKEAATARWEQGWWYLADLVGPYWLWVPIVLLLGLAAVTVSTTASAERRSLDHRRWVLSAAPVLGGALSALYVVRVGGDFMHARLLLPALFAMLVPISVVAVDRARVVWVAAIAVWAVICAATLRPGYTAAVGPHQIGDERGAWTRYVAGTPNPVSLADFRLVTAALDHDRSVASHQRVLILINGSSLSHPTPDRVLPLARTVPAQLAVESIPVGLLSYGVGPDARVVDLAGLADPVGGRLHLERRGRPGHEKHLPDVWVVAALVEPSAPLPPTVPRSATGAPLAAARRARTCGALDDILTATEDPMSWARFVANIGVSVRTFHTRVPSDPRAAERVFCRSPP